MLDWWKSEEEYEKVKWEGKKGEGEVIDEGRRYGQNERSAYSHRKITLRHSMAQCTAVLFGMEEWSTSYVQRFQKLQSMQTSTVTVTITVALSAALLHLLKLVSRRTRCFTIQYHHIQLRAEAVVIYLPQYPIPLPAFLLPPSLTSFLFHSIRKRYCASRSSNLCISNSQLSILQKSSYSIFCLHSVHRLLSPVQLTWHDMTWHDMT